MLLGRLRRLAMTEHRRQQASSQQRQKRQSQPQRETAERTAMALHPWRAS